MTLLDTDKIIRDYLLTCTTLTALVSTRIYCPRLPENATLPAVSFFARGGLSDPYIPGIVTPSIQFDCWADDPEEARSIYMALYDNLQGIQNVTVGGSISRIMSAIEEVQGQDLVDTDIPTYFRCLTFFSLMIRAE